MSACARNWCASCASASKVRVVRNLSRSAPPPSRDRLRARVRPYGCRLGDLIARSLAEWGWVSCREHAAGLPLAVLAASTGGPATLDEAAGRICGRLSRSGAGGAAHARNFYPAVCRTARVSLAASGQAGRERRNFARRTRLRLSRRLPLAGAPPGRVALDTAHALPVTAPAST